MDKMVQPLDAAFLRGVFEMHAKKDPNGISKIDYNGLKNVFKMI